LPRDVRRRLPLILLAVIAALYAALIVTRPAPMDWRPDYGGASARPLGADVLRALLPVALAPASGAPAAVRDVEEAPFLHLGRPRGDTTYVFVADAFEPDEAETERLLAHARRGATVFVAARKFEGPFAAALARDVLAKAGQAAGLRIWYVGRTNTAADSILHLPDGPAAGLRFPFAATEWVLRGLDTTSTQVLARGRDGLPVVARVPQGTGAVIVSSVPDAFSNAALMGADGLPTDGPAFAAGVLAHLPAGPAFWDEYVKPRRSASSSPLRFVLSRPPLRMAYLLAVAGVIAYVVFRGRRWQRAIPVVEPPPNAAAEFVRTLGRLHFQHGDHRALVERRARYAVDRLRTRLGVSEADLSPETEARLIRRGLPEDVVREAFARMRSPGRPVDAADVVALDRALERLWQVAG
jgi:hypothetical protein